MRARNSGSRHSAFVIRPNLTGITLTTLVLAVSLVIMPTWPWVWFKQAVVGGFYEGFVPLLWRPGGVPVGLLLLIALPLWRSWQARVLLFFSITPQRMFYDQLVLVYGPALASNDRAAGYGKLAWFAVGTDGRELAVVGVWDTLFAGTGCALV